MLAFAATAAMLTSCFKEEPLGNECDIEEAYIHADIPGDVFFQPSDSLVRVTATQDMVNFAPLRPGTDLTRLAPCFRITEGATISPANGSEHDFSQGPVVYTVTSEDGAWQRTYHVAITAMAPDTPDTPEEQTDSVRYDFENSYLETQNNRYYMWSDYLADGSLAYNWATGNAGFVIARGSAAPDEYPSVPLADGYDGKAVQLTTRSTGPFGKMVNMRLAAGNLFTGVFESRIATKTPLLATHFGDGAANKINFKPVNFSGYYQYKPGETFQDKLGKTVDGRIDEGDIYAIVFKNTDSEGNAFYLNGNNVQTSTQIVAKALSGHVTATDGGWHKFDINFEYTQELDPQVLANYGYSIAVVFTSSCEGAAFEGAVGSTLLIDKVRIAYERPTQKK